MERTATVIPFGCDTMVALPRATAGGQTIFAKNSDRPADECQPLVQRPRASHPPRTITRCQFVELPEAKTTYRHVGSRPHWCYGYEHGFNEHQVVIGNEGLHSKFTFSEPKLVGMEVLRLGLERGRTAAEAVDVMTDVITRYGQGEFQNDAGVRTYDNGYLVADPHEAYVIETAGHEWAVERIELSNGISNLYSVKEQWQQLSPTAPETAIQQGWWNPERSPFNFGEAYMHESYCSATATADRRRERSCTVLKQHISAIDVPLMMALLRDHSDGLQPDEPLQTEIRPGRKICVHYDEDGIGGNTAASLVADLCGDGSRLPVYWCSFYSPCLGVFFPVFMEGTLPAVLSVGEALPSDSSPWWMFHRLSRIVRGDAAPRIPIVRRRWAEFQLQLFQTTYGIAVEARHLVDNGETDRAGKLLTEFMNENIQEMMTIVVELCHYWTGDSLA